MRGWATPLMLSGLACLSGTDCAGLGPKADPSRFFTLTPLPQTDSATAGCSSTPTQLALAVGPISLPGYLDREQLVTRVSQNRFDVAANDRWAEPLADNFAGVLAENLSALLGSERVTLYPWASDRHPAYQVEVEVMRFEADTAGSAQLIARWLLRDVASKKALDVRESRLAGAVSGASREASVAALSQVLGRFSCEVAEALRATGGRE